MFTIPFITARKDLFWKVLFCAALVFFSLFLMFAGTLSLERLDGSQPNFHTRWRGRLNPIENGCHRLSRLAAILEKLCFHTIMTVQVLLTVLVKPLLRLNH